MPSRFATLLVLLLLCCNFPGLTQDIFDVEIMEVQIEFAEDDWDEKLREIKLSKAGGGLLASVQIGDHQYDSIQVRYKGNSSFHGALKSGITKLPFRFKAPKGHRFAGGYKTLKLSNNYRDPSQVRELIGYQVVGSYMPVPKVRPAVVYVNSEFVGVYTITEGIEKPMLTRYFGSEKGTLIKCEPDNSTIRPPECPASSFASLEYLGEDIECYKGLYEIEKEETWENLITLALALEERPEHVQNFINVDQVLWMHALNNVIVNLDSYLGIFCHNYYMYQDTSGLFHPLIWDLNLSFGGFHWLKQGVEVNLVKLSPIIHDRARLTDRPLITRLLEIEKYRHQYYTNMQRINEEWFVSGKYLEVGAELQALIDPWVALEPSPEFSYEDFQRSLHEPVKRGKTRTIMGIGELMEQRKLYLLEHPLLTRELAREGLE